MLTMHDEHLPTYLPTYLVASYQVPNVLTYLKSYLLPTYLHMILNHIHGHIHGVVGRRVYMTGFHWLVLGHIIHETIVPKAGWQKLWPLQRDKKTICLPGNSK
jgi:hypothetical protein